MKRILAILWLSACASFAASWYVDNAATGARNGTSWANAWTNLNNVSGITAGDTIYISGGSTSKRYVVFDGTYYTWQPHYKGNGTAGNPITYKVGQDAGHNGVVVFDTGPGNSWFYDDNWHFGVISGDYNGANHIIVTNSSTSAASVVADGSDNLRFDHITFNSWVKANGCSNIIFSYCEINPPAETSVAMVLSTTGTTWTNNQIYGCTFILPASSNSPAWGTDGISGGSFITCYSNTFSARYVTNDTEWQHQDGWQNYGTGSVCKIYANTFNNIGNYGVFWEMNGSTRDVWIYNNVVQYNDSFYHADGANVGIVLGQRTAGSTISNIVVANNTVVDNFSRTGISLGDDPGESNTWTNIVVANNLLMNSGNSGEAALVVSLTGGGTNGFAIYNNKALSGARGTNFISPSQLVTPGGATTDPFVSYTELDPANDLRLASSITTAIDQGSDLSSYFTTDKDSATRSGTWDLGAYEYDAGGDVTSPTCAITSPASVSSGGSGSYSTSSSTITVSGTSDDATATITWSNSRGGAGTATGSTSWSQAGIALASGGNVLTFIATDPSLNASTTTLNVTYTVPAAGGTTNNVGTLRIY